jgi:hypothetical protein
MGYYEPVRKALKAADELASLLEADFDAARGGFTWWHDYGLEIDAVTGIMDYLYGLVSGVRENLRIAASHLADLKEYRYSDDLWMTGQFRATGHPPVRGDFEARREARIDSHTAGVLRAAGSILDNLAGIVVAIGGFDTDLMKSSLGLLLPLDDGPKYPGPKVRGQLHLDKTVLDPADRQGSLLRATRSSLQHAGPEGWLGWTRQSRDDRVHRASRISVAYFHKDKIFRPLPRQPEHADSHAFRGASSTNELLLEEDSLVTLAGVVDSLNIAVVGTFIECVALWCYRKGHPDHIAQPVRQWPTDKPPRDTTFPGYLPGSATLPDDSVVLISPSTGARLTAARVLDGQTPAR